MAFQEKSPDAAAHRYAATRPRKLIWVLATGVVVVLLGVVWNQHRILSRWVSCRALRDAELEVHDLFTANALSDTSMEDLITQLGEEYRWYFEAGYFDRKYLLSHVFETAAS